MAVPVNVNIACAEAESNPMLFRGTCFLVAVGVSVLRATTLSVIHILVFIVETGRVFLTAGSNKAMIAQMRRLRRSFADVGAEKKS